MDQSSIPSTRANGKKKNTFKDLNLKENTCDYMYNYCQNYGDVEGEKWDVVDDESRGANGVADC